MEVIDQGNEGIGQSGEAPVIDRPAGREQRGQQAAEQRPGQDEAEEELQAEAQVAGREGLPEQDQIEHHEPEVVDDVDGAGHPGEGEQGMKDLPGMPAEVEPAVPDLEGGIPGEGVDHPDHGLEAGEDRQEGRQDGRDDQRPHHPLDGQDVDAEILDHVANQAPGPAHHHDVERVADQPGAGEAGHELEVDQRIERQRHAVGQVVVVDRHQAAQGVDHDKGDEPAVGIEDPQDRAGEGIRSFRQNDGGHGTRPR